MPRDYSHADCFDYFGTIPRNPRWSWSGRSADGKDVAVTLWQDRFSDGGRIYRNWNTDIPGAWRSRPGFVELIENLVHARDHIGGFVHVILARPKDSAATPRSIARCFPSDQLKMRVIELDENAGTFALERVEV